MTRCAGRCLIHPVDSVVLLLLSGGFLEVLEFLDLALFFALATQLIYTLALLERFLLFGPYALLVAEERRVP